MKVSHSIPAAAINGPPVIRTRGPRVGSSRAATGAVIMVAKVIARLASPADRGESPSTICRWNIRYSVIPM